VKRTCRVAGAHDLEGAPRCTGLIDIMRHAISLNGSFFTARRVLQEYLIKAYSQ